MNLTKKRAVADLGARNGAGARQVQVQYVREDGRIGYRVERLPWGRSMKVVKFSGSVEEITLHNGCANTATDDAYALDRQTRKPMRGSIPVGRCLQTQPMEVLDGFMPPKWYGPGTRVVPEELLGRPACRVAADGKSKIDNRHPCQCIVDLIAVRKAANAERMNDIEQRSAADRQADAAEGMVEAVAGLANVVKNLQENAQGKRGKGGAE